ncbi:MAG TPA: hypothetical protein VIJ79_05610 [Acidobacteriaceae bacterium]
MNHASEHDIDRVLTALRDIEPSVGLESRILQALENHTPTRSAWVRWAPATQWSIAALATAAVVLAIALTTHNTRRPPSTIAQTWGPHNSSSSPTQFWGDPSSPEASSPAKVGAHTPTSTIAQTWGDPSSPEASSPAKVGAHNTPTTELSSRPEAAHFAAVAERPAVGTTGAPTPGSWHLTSAPTPPTYPPHQLLCDCDPIAMAEMQAPSQLAPEMPLTAQERLLQRVVHHDDPIEIAELEPLHAHAPQAAPAPQEDDPVKNVVQQFLKQLAAAEALNPTTPASDSNDPDPNIDSSPN